MYRYLPALLGVLSCASAKFTLEDVPNAVSSCYSVWHSLAVKPDGSIYGDNTDTTNAGRPYVDGLTYAWWGRPAIGYYPGGDRAVYSTHFQQMTDAGIDFIIIDGTNVYNAVSYDDAYGDSFIKPLSIMLDEMIAQRFLGGKKTPYVVLWMHSDHDAEGIRPITFAYDRWYSNETLADLWVYYEGKPLIVTTNNTAASGTPYASKLTFRKLWGLEDIDENGEWSYLTNYPQTVGTYNGVDEQISVCVGKEGTPEVHYAPFSDEKDSTPRLQGRTYQQQWSRAFATHPKVVTLTWWNQWIAVQLGNSTDPLFVDEWLSEYSNDIEPQDPNQETGHGSYYLEWTKEYISAYKANQPMPTGLVGYN